MKEVVTEVISVLFADVKDFSKINNDRLYSILKDYIDSFASHNLIKTNHFLFKTWGDGILVCSYNPHDLLEISLKLNDWFQNKNWGREGFPFRLLLRTGLHTEKANVEYSSGVASDVIGRNINTAARIEPVVEPGKIFCSEKFRSLADEENSDFVSFSDLGMRELAKGFGQMQLFEILKHGSMSSQTVAKTEFQLGDVKIRKDFTQLDKDNYLQKAYTKTHDYMKGALDELARRDGDVETKFEDVRSDKFTCQVYVRGQKKSECQIWLGSSFGRGLCYYEGISTSDNSMNDSVTVQSDGYRLHLSSFGIGFSGRSDQPTTLDNIGEMLWKKFAKTLER